MDGSADEGEGALIVGESLEEVERLGFRPLAVLLVFEDEFRRVGEGRHVRVVLLVGKKMPPTLPRQPIREDVLAERGGYVGSVVEMNRKPTTTMITTTVHVITDCHRRFSTANKLSQTGAPFLLKSLRRTDQGATTTVTNTCKDPETKVNEVYNVI